MDVGNEADVDRKATEAKTRKIALHDDLRELLDMESGAGKRVLRWVVYDLGGLMSPGVADEEYVRALWAGKRTLAGEVNDQLEAAREDSSIAVLLEGTGVQPTEGKKR